MTCPNCNEATKVVTLAPNKYQCETCKTHFTIGEDNTARIDNETPTKIDDHEKRLQALEAKKKKDNENEPDYI